MREMKEESKMRNSKLEKETQELHRVFESEKGRMKANY
jgi:hypothetical protein